MTRSTVTTILTLLFLGCGDGGSGDGGPDTDATGTTETDPTAGPGSNPSGPSSDTSATDPDGSSTDPTMADASSTDGDACTENDQCIVAEDCAPGQDCVGCLCFGDPMGCADWGMEGVYGDCQGPGDPVCMAAGAGCIGDGADASVCFYSGCEMPCDCPQPPAGYEDAVECASISAGDETLDCFIGCDVNEDCPDEMFCVGARLCMFGDPPEPPPPAPAYADCVNEEVACEDGICLQDAQVPTWGFCGPTCESTDDCPEPPTGDVAEECRVYNKNGDMACVLPCTPASSCPDGMVCQAGFNLCVWEVEDEPMPPPPPYGDCENNPVEEACAETDACIVAAADAGSVCAGPCEDVEDCAAGPKSGTAVLTCGDLGDGNVCHLSCAVSEDCPDGMACFEATYCHFEPS